MCHANPGHPAALPARVPKAMSAPYSSSYGHYGRLGRAYWLPPGGIGNGLDAPAWVPLLDVEIDEMIVLLHALRDAGIAGYAAQVDKTGRRVPASIFRIWVDTWAHARAEDVVARTMPRFRDTGL